jgi:hypothetical protein
MPTYQWCYGSFLPQSGGLHSVLGYNPNPNDTLYLWQPSSNTYTNYAYVTNKSTGVLGWYPSEPQIQVGQGFVLAPGAKNAWTQSFSVSGCQ